jgi:transposase
MAAKAVLTPALRARIEAQLAAGTTQAVVAQRAGVNPRTVRQWLAAGKVARPPSVRIPPPAEPVMPTTEGESLSERLARAEPGLVAAVIQAAQRGSWQAAAWLLERSFPERWGRRDAPPPMPPADAFGDVDELAARRRLP